MALTASAARTADRLGRAVRRPLLARPSPPGTHRPDGHLPLLRSCYNCCRSAIPLQHPRRHRMQAVTGAAAQRPRTKASSRSGAQSSPPPINCSLQVSNHIDYDLVPTVGSPPSGWQHAPVAYTSLATKRRRWRAHRHRKPLQDDNGLQDRSALASPRSSSTQTEPSIQIAIS